MFISFIDQVYMDFTATGIYVKQRKNLRVEYELTQSNLLRRLTIILDLSNTLLF